MVRRISLLLIAACAMLSPVLPACESNVAPPSAASSSSQGGGGSGAQGGAGGEHSLGGAGGELSLGGFSAEGGSMMMRWDHVCADTGIDVLDQTFDSACPGDYWANVHYDGATTHETYNGFTGEIDLVACNETGDRSLSLYAVIDGPGSYMLIDGLYDQDGTQHELVSGTIDIQVDGWVGENVIGSYSGLFAPTSGEPVMLSGNIAACHLPPFALP